MYSVEAQRSRESQKSNGRLLVGLRCALSAGCTAGTSRGPGHIQSGAQILLGGEQNGFGGAEVRYESPEREIYKHGRRGVHGNSKN